MLMRHGLFLAIVLVYSQVCFGELIGSQSLSPWPAPFSVQEAITSQPIVEDVYGVRPVAYEVCAGSSCQATGCSKRCPKYTIQGGALFMDRDNAHGILLQDNSTSDNVTAPDLGFQGGMKISVIRHRCAAHDIEIGVMGLFSDSGVNVGSVDDDMEFPTTPNVGIIDDGFLLSNYRSSLVGIETNLRSQHSACISTFAGFRWMMLDEDLAYSAVVPGGPQAIGGFNSTCNNLLGGQVGMDAVLCRHGCFTVEGGIQAGVYWNLASQDSLIVDTSTGPAFISEDGSQLSFQGEAELLAVYQLNRRWAVRGGYQVMWIEGVALAPDQISALNLITSSGLDVEGSPFYHGAVAQLELRF